MTSTLSPHRVEFLGLVGTSLGLFGVADVVSIAILSSLSPGGVTAVDVFVGSAVASSAALASIGVWLVRTADAPIHPPGGRR